MKKACFPLGMVIVFSLLAGCSSERGLNGDAAFAGASLASNPDSPEFTYYYHGFLVEEIGEENPTVPSEIYMIDTQEEYAQFFLNMIYPRSIRWTQLILKTSALFTAVSKVRSSSAGGPKEFSPSAYQMHR